MPIIVNDYSWQQTDNHITINVPLKNGNIKDVDILTSKKYIKANYYPYIFELFLFNNIDEKNSKCYIKDNDIIFELCKAEYGPWDKLEVTLNKSEKLELKKIYLEEIQKEAQHATSDKLTKRGELKRVGVREQIEVDSKFRQKIDDIKKKETEKALKELKLFEENKAPTTKDRIISPKKNKEINIDSSKVIPHRKSPAPAIPVPRKCQSVNISFTTREFPTPSRESKSQEEQEWLAKQAEARRKCGFDDGDLRPEERNPQWLKDKGDEFFKAKNYIAAISAYTTGIKISKKFVALYVNRSAAHFAVGNLNKTVHDCSTALELMVPICEANRVLRAKCLARRAAALCKLGLWREGKGEMEAAIKLMPNDEALKQDLKNIESKLEPQADIIIDN